MEKIQGKDNAHLIEAAKERLRWYTMEASEEEFDADEVDALVKLLNTLTPIEENEKQDEEQILERFRAYVELRESEESESEEKKSIENADNCKRNKGLVLLIRTHKFVAVAALVLLVLIVAGGAHGVVNASQGKGFFHWLKRDEEGTTMITTPKNLDSNVVLGGEIQYESLDAVPEEYKRHLIAKEEIEELQEYELKKITGHKNESFCRVTEWFADKSGKKNVYIEVFIYGDETRLSREVYLGKEVQLPENDDELQEGTLIRENATGDKENTIYFYKDNVQYCIEGDIKYEILEKIAEAYKTIKFQ